MNLERLRSVRSTERERDSLQALSDSFYADVGTFVAELREERDRVAREAEDPFDSPEVRRLSNDIGTAENTIEALYERRVGKLVKLASLEAAGMATDAEGLTTEERDLFETLVQRIESNRAHVLENVLAGEEADPGVRDSSADPTTDTPTGDPTADRTPEAPDPSDQNGTVETSAADAMATDEDRNEHVSGDRADERAGERSVGDGGARTPSTPEVEATTPTDSAPDDARGVSPEAPTAGSNREPSVDDTDTTEPDGSGIDPDSETDPDSGTGTGVDVERETVRITRDVGEILGVDEHVYELSADDVVTLPVVNATPLLERDAAETLAGR